MYEYVEQKPKFEDCCSHGKDAYIGSVKYPRKDDDGKFGFHRLDIYHYHEDWPCGQQFCLRYGNEPGEYLSPGGLVEVITAASRSEKYRAVLGLLRNRGTVGWTSRRVKKDRRKYTEDVRSKPGRSGYDRRGSAPCPRCEGKGELFTVKDDPEDLDDIVFGGEECPVCKGVGRDYS